ncbi:MAG: DUF5717 family protein [Defluviitaleaceae bacterium]|nr:DUF5717 family protein [Defluviitaleaceae bacterium]
MAIAHSKLLTHLEYPSPKIALSTDRIDARGAELVEGSFEVFNIGEGELEGRIDSASDFLSFPTDTFAGNKVSIDYSINLEGLTGEHKATAILTSNGGEKIVAFEIKVNPPAIVRGTNKIATPEHFMEYLKKNPIDARRLFGQKDFMIWLFNTGYQSMDIYEKFAADPNKERAADNFLIFSGLKNKADIVPEQTDIVANIGHGESVATGGLCLRKTTWGYAEADFKVRQGERWFKLTKERIISADFADDNTTELDYIIMAEEIKRRDVAIVDVIADCGQTRSIRVQCNISGAFEAKLDKEAYHFEDSGKLLLHNNTGKDLMIDIYCENFVKFEAQRYFIGKYAEIDFQIKFSSLKAATLAFKKQLQAATYVHIRAAAAGRDSVKKLKLKLWGKS